MVKTKKVIVSIIIIALLAGLAFAIYAKVSGLGFGSRDDVADDTGDIYEVVALASKETKENKEVEAQALSVAAKAGLLMDYDTGTIVFEKKPDERLPIASMVKIMTLNLIYDEIAAGNLSFDTDIVVSQNAASMGGSQAFLDANATYKAGELIRTIVVASANDSCVALAEHISGSSEAFVEKMNHKAAELGMLDTNFANCTGLPSPNGYSTAKDVAIMTRQLIKHQDFFVHSTEWMFDFAHPSGRTTELSNTNKLVRFYEGCDGGKTGFTNEAAYCLSATAKRGSTRLISVILGSPSSKERNAENSKLFNHGFSNYETKQIVFKDLPLEEAVSVSRGKAKQAAVSAQSDLFHFAKKGKINIETEVVLNEVKAPLAIGAPVGELIAKIDGTEVGRVAIKSDEEVAKKSYLDYIKDGLAAW